jgi:hypothetical protein
MVEFLILASPLLLILAVSSYFKWRHTEGNSEHRNGGWLIYLLDNLAGLASGVALTLALGGFDVEGREVHHFLLSLIKGMMFFAIGFNIIFRILQRVQGFGHKLIAYSSVLVLIALCVVRLQAEAAARDARPKPKPTIYRPEPKFTLSLQAGRV